MNYTVVYAVISASIYQIKYYKKTIKKKNKRIMKTSPRPRPNQTLDHALQRRSISAAATRIAMMRRRIGAVALAVSPPSLSHRRGSRGFGLWLSRPFSVSVVLAHFNIFFFFNLCLCICGCGFLSFISSFSLSFPFTLLPFIP